jgi:hypothetical protein
MPSIRKAVVLAIAFAGATVAGCATQGQLEAIKVAVTAREEMDHLKSCAASIEVKPEYARIYEKLGVAKSDDLNRRPSQTQLADEENVSDDDIALGLSWYVEMEQCEVPAIESLSRVAPESLAYFADDLRERTDIVNDIVTTKPTYGHINQRLLELKLRRKETAPELGRKLHARLIAEHQEELQEREDIAETVAEVALDALVVLATRQSRLVRSAQLFASTNSRYHVPRVTPIRCDAAFKSALATTVGGAKVNATSASALTKIEHLTSAALSGGC